MRKFTKPAYVTFTGVDRPELIEEMLALSKRYPIEWGVLIHLEKVGQPLFPSTETIEVFRAAGLRLSAHVCGQEAIMIANGQNPNLNLSGFSRAQINHGFAGSNEEQIANCAQFGARNGIRIALQVQGEFPNDPRVDWLYDVSFGEGRKPKSFPAIDLGLPFCGLSGGFSDLNSATNLEKAVIADDCAFWIDMESGVRTAGEFDIEKCKRVCSQVFDD